MHFLTSLRRTENCSEAQMFEQGWNDSKMVKRPLASSVSFQRQAGGGPLSFHLSPVGLVIVFCLLFFNFFIIIFYLKDVPLSTCNVM